MLEDIVGDTFISKDDSSVDWKLDDGGLFISDGIWKERQLRG